MNANLSIVLPSFRGSDLLKRNLPLLLNYLSSLSLTWEVIVVDDGSDDGGATRKAAEDLNLKYISLPENLGKGAAVRAGMLQATGDVRLFTDVDLPFELNNIEQFYRCLTRDGFQIAIGDRTLPASNYFKDVPLLRRVSSRIFSSLVSLLIVNGIHDSQCGLKAFRSDVAQDLFGVARIDRFAMDVEVLYIALKRNYRIQPLPVTLRGWEDSGIQIGTEAPRMLLDLARIKMNYGRGRYAKK